MAKKTQTTDSETPPVEPIPEETPPLEPAGTVDSGTVQPHEDWERRFKGMQTAYNKQQTQLAEQSADYEKTLGEVEELRAQAKAFEGEKEGILAQLTELDTIKGELLSQINTHSLQAERSKLIMEEFMDLAQFEAKGLLPSAENVEEMKERFENFRQAFNTSVDQTMKNRMVGMSTAPSSNLPPQPRTKETVYAELTRLAGKKTAEEQARYDALMQEWLELNPL
jgi:hypothetical protein